MEKSSDLISIVVPVYNAEKYLEKCINSILNQSYTNIELVLVNDGSIDNSFQIMEKFSKADKRVVVISQKNSGVSAARNNGIKHSSGKYISFVDADDYIDCDYVEYLHNLIADEVADVSLTYFPKKISDVENNYEKNRINNQIEKMSGIEASICMLSYKIVISSWNKMYKKELLDKYNILFNTNLSYGEGFDFVMSCFQHSNLVVASNKKIYNYRVDNPNSAMTSFKEKLVYGSLDAQESIKEKLIYKNDKILNAWNYSFWHTNCDCLNTVIGCKVKNKYSEMYKMLKRNCRKYALYSFKVDINLKNRLKSIMYFIAPVFTAKLINHFRVRKFTVEK